MAPAPRGILRTTVLSVIYLLVFAAVLFIPAGIDWRLGWLFLAIFTVCTLLTCIYLWRVNPEIFEARSRLSRVGTKGWDKVLLIFILLAFFAVFLIASLDARFHWSALPREVIALGYALFLLGFAGSTWVYAVNKFAEPTVRIQTDRHHTVITTGPYSFVRHPPYVAGFILIVGCSLALGSLWALLPVAGSIAILILRTSWEDAALQNELEGYRAYAARVRYRLLPGIW